jgi:UDP-N-acetylglucosamine acyltransferase
VATGLAIDGLARILGDVALSPPAIVGAGAVLEGPLTAGPGLRVHPGAFVGGPAQHRRGGEGRLRLGRNVQVREAATIHRGSPAGSGLTQIGDRVIVMAYAHVGHDCDIDEDVVISNGVQLGGHVRVGRGAVLGARAAVHQFVRIGAGAMVAAGAMVSGDVPPFSMVAGDRARVVGENRVALQVLTKDAAEAIRAALRRLMAGGGGGSPAERRTAVLDGLRAELSARPEAAVSDFAAFLRETGTRPLCGRSRGQA